MATFLMLAAAALLESDRKAPWVREFFMSRRNK